MRKIELHFTNEDGETVITIPDGGYVKLSFADRIIIRQCKHIRDGLFEIGSSTFYTGDFAEYMEEYGIECEALDEEELETVQGYIITDKTFLGRRVIAIGYSRNAHEPYVTWSKKPNAESYSIGRYFKHEREAVKNYLWRISEYRGQMLSPFFPQGI